MAEDKIIIKGARQHNLKNINIQLPKNKLVVLTGVSGSGKSSLAFDTIYAEGQRRYVESLSAYARQFLGLMDKPEVDSIEGLSPSISISQKTVSHNPRSTVGTVTEIYDYLRLLFARIGHPHCPECGHEIARQDSVQIMESMSEIIHRNTNSQLGNKPSRWLILSPVVRDRKGEFRQLLDNLKAKGYSYARIDGKFLNLEEDDLVLIKTNKHDIDVVVDKLTVGRKMVTRKCKSSKNTKKEGYMGKITEATEQALDLSDGLVILSQVKDASFEFPEKPEKMQDYLFSEKFSCPECNLNIAEIEPRIFSFNTPHGACLQCGGLGTVLQVEPDLVLNNNLTIKEGAIIPLASQFENNTWLSRTILTACRENDIPLTTELGKFTEKQKDTLLNGTGDRVYEVQGQNRFGRQTTIAETFPGIIKILEDRYNNSQSEHMREQIERFMRKETCPECFGTRLKPEALSITIQSTGERLSLEDFKGLAFSNTALNIAQVTQLSIKDALIWIKSLKLSNREKIIGKPIINEIENRLRFLTSVGLDYINLAREAGTLAGGEAQRIVLASQIGSGLTGVLYVLDEPSIGLHQRDNKRLIKTLRDLRDLGNTVIVVEHDQETIENADHLVDFGPGGGKHGGEIIAQGGVEEIKRCKESLTGDYLSRRKQIEMRNKKHNSTSHLTDPTSLSINGCKQYNLKNIDVEFPLGKLICVTGVSGSGKSTLVVETLYKTLKLQFNPYYKEIPGEFQSIKNWDKIKSVQLIDQSPIGRTPRSNPATYTKAFDHIRDLFASTKQSKMKGYKKGRFSFNVKGGRCEACEGQGENKIEMQFMADVYVKCEVCEGRRYNSQTLEVTYKNKNIAEILEMTVEDSVSFFKNIPPLYRKLKTLDDVGLSYIEIGQPAPILSGGEAQRVKLASELSKHGKGNTLYILDEPTTGLHFHDLKKLLKVLRGLVKKGNTVIVIEHNLDIIKNADWIIDLGPEGGDSGGEVVAKGTPKDIAQIKDSYTGQFLRELL